MCMSEYHIHQGNNIDILRTLEDSSIDAVVTDPPYGIEFLAKDWDKNTGATETWQECLRVLKPGGYLLAFSAARTYHQLATNIESVGFEIRDQIMWLYASGFPKALDIGKAIQKRKHTEEHNEWSGWKTALKPSHEPIVMARKPFKGSTMDNVLEHGVGALNIDASRIPFQDDRDFQSASYGQDKSKTFGYINTEQQDTYSKPDITVVEANQQGRFPSNVIGEVQEGYQKYFYCPKVSRRERHCGFEQDDDLAHIPTNPEGKYEGKGDARHANERIALKSQGNNHPTVKPVALMRYLITLVTPPNSTVLDPFTGSGSTGMAACELGHKFIGCELDEHYVEIANKRIQGWLRQHTEVTPQQHNKFGELFDER